MSRKNEWKSGDVCDISYTFDFKPIKTLLLC